MISTCTDISTTTNESEVSSLQALLDVQVDRPLANTSFTPASRYRFHYVGRKNLRLYALSICAPVIYALGLTKHA
jgi:hypothetical protein